jgi:hypothetical protein
LDDGKIYRKALYLMVKTMVSCRFSLKPVQWHTLFWPHFPGKTLTPPIFRQRKLGESGRFSHRRRFPELGLPAQRPTASGLGPLRIHAGGPLRMTRSTKHGLSIISGSSLIISHNLSES